MPVNRRAIVDGRARRSRGGFVVEMRPLQLSEQLVLIADEALAFVKALIEPTDESLIVHAEARNDRPQTFGNLLGIPRFQVVVNQQDHVKGNPLSLEGGDFLVDIVFKYAEFVAPQV